MSREAFKLCRVCLHDDNLKSIFSCGFEVMQTFIHLSGLMFLPESQDEVLICSECLQNIHFVLDFSQLIKISEAKYFSSLRMSEGNAQIRRQTSPDSTESQFRGFPNATSQNKKSQEESGESSTRITDVSLLNDPAVILHAENAGSGASTNLSKKEEIAVPKKLQISHGLSSSTKSTKNVLRCTRCQQSFANLSRKKRHACPCAVPSNSPGKMFSCDLCDFSTIFKNLMTCHIHQQHSTVKYSERLYACKIGNCKNRYMLKGSLFKHRQKHKLVKPHECHCGRSFSKHGLKMHQKSNLPCYS